MKVLIPAAGQGVRLTKLDHTTRNRAAAWTAVADVEDAFLLIVDRVHQPGLFGLPQDALGLVLGNRADMLHAGKGPFDRGKVDTVEARVFTFLAD